MHTMDSNSNVPAFINKLWKLVEDPNYDHLIQWNQNGRSFIIHDQSKFAKELLPLYFKHSNMASFIRQLNMYGFRKVSNIENSGLRSERDDIEFYNQHFVKGREYELEYIKRKVPLKSSQQIPTGGKPGLNSAHFKHEDVSDILTDMESIKGKQDSVDSLLTNMQRENEALWREVAILRQKHHKQQQIVEKLIQFLVTLVQNRGLMGIKRKAQLMIDDSEDNRQKLRQKMMKRNDVYGQQYSPGNSRSNGPIIHDITDTDIEDNLIASSSPIVTDAVSEMSPNPNVLLPETSTSAINTSNGPVLVDSKANILDPLRESIKELGLVPEPTEEPAPDSANAVADVESLLNTTLNTPPGSPSILKQSSFDTTSKSKQNQNNITDLVVSNKQSDQSMTESSLNNHVEGIEAELDWLQDQLSSGINIDTATLLGVRSDSALPSALNDNNWLKQLFAMENNDNNQIPNYSQLLTNPNNEIMGNEVIQFNPNSSSSVNSNALFDDLDLDQITNDESRDPLLDEELLPNLDLVNEGTVSFPPEAVQEKGH